MRCPFALDETNTGVGDWSAASGRAPGRVVLRRFAGATHRPGRCPRKKGNQSRVVCVVLAVVVWLCWWWSERICVFFFCTITSFPLSPNPSFSFSPMLIFSTGARDVHVVCGAQHESRRVHQRPPPLQRQGSTSTIQDTYTGRIHDTARQLVGRLPTVWSVCHLGSCKIRLSPQIESYLTLGML
jgi:hypothetical protein